MRWRRGTRHSLKFLFHLALSCWLLHVLWRLSLRPRIVGIGEHQAVRQWRMRVEPEGNKRRRIGVRQVHFTENLKRVRRDLFRMRDNTLNDFHAENARG